MARIDSRFIIWGTGPRQVNSQVIPANFTPSVYAPVQVASEGNAQISSNLKGIDTYLGLRHTSQTTATTANGTLTLVAANNDAQFLTGTATGFTVVLPNATTLTANRNFVIYNQSSQIVTVKDGSGAILFTLGQTSIGFLTLQLNATAAGTWVSYETFIGVASGIVNYQVVSSTPFTTTAATDVPITGVTITPTAGTYAIWFNCSATGSGSGLNSVSIYNGSSQIADSLRQAVAPAGAHIFQMSTQTISLFNGTNACTVDVNAAGTSITVNQRSLILVRLGN